jgi:hypothetical protein
MGSTGRARRVVWHFAGCIPECHYGVADKFVHRTAVSCDRLGGNGEKSG